MPSALRLSTAALRVAAFFTAAVATGCRDAQERVHERILEQGFAFSVEDFLKAVAEGRAVTVKQFLEAGANPNAADSEGCPALIHAARRGHGHLVELLTRHGANVKIKGPGGLTPLIAAAAGGDPAGVRALLAAGADVHARDDKGMSALGAAALEGHAGIVELLVSHSPDARGRALQLAALKGHTAVMDILLKAGADPDFLSGDGRTPLMFAASRGHWAAVRLLCHRGARAHLQSMDGHTAATLAEAAGHGELAAFLREEETNPGFLSREPDAAKMIAAAIQEAKPAVPPPAIPAPQSAVTTAPVSSAPAPSLKRLGGLRLPEADFGDLEALPQVMAMTDFHLRRLPAVLRDVAKGHGSATVELLDENRVITVKVGDTIPGTGCVVEKLRRRHLYKNGKDGELVNVSEIHLKRGKTGERFKALKDQRISSGENAAHLRLAGVPAVLEAREGDEFRLGPLLLKVTELKPSGVTIENRLTKETVTLPPRTGEAPAAPAATTDF